MARKVFPERNMRDSHPYEVWQALLRLQVFHKISDTGREYFNTFDIGTTMFSNWSILDLKDRLNVISHKIKFPLSCLRVMGYVERNTILDSWRARKIPIQHIISKDEQDCLTYSIIDDYWRSFKAK